MMRKYRTFQRQTKLLLKHTRNCVDVLYHKFAVSDNSCTQTSKHRMKKTYTLFYRLYVNFRRYEKLRSIFIPFGLRFTPGSSKAKSITCQFLKIQLNSKLTLSIKYRKPLLSSMDKYPCDGCIQVASYFIQQSIS